MRPVAASSGPAGISALQAAAAASRPFPLVLLDLNMPEMDGFAVAARIRDTPNLAGATVMMLTSSTQRDDAKRCRELGISSYLVKPVRQAELLEAMIQALGVHAQTSQRVREEPKNTEVAAKSLRILVAEDNPVNQTVAIRLLQKHGHSVVIASDGKEALHKFVEAGPGGFDLVLMDVQMPEMDGFAVTAAIRERDKAASRHTHVIAMTAHALKGDRERCLAAGMDDYVSKPVQSTQLLSAIASCVGDGAAFESERDPARKGAVYDQRAALERLAGDHEVFEEMVSAFLDVPAATGRSPRGRGAPGRSQPGPRRSSPQRSCGRSLCAGSLSGRRDDGKNRKNRGPHSGRTGLRHAIRRDCSTPGRPWAAVGT